MWWVKDGARMPFWPMGKEESHQPLKAITWVGVHAARALWHSGVSEGFEIWRVKAFKRSKKEGLTHIPTWHGRAWLPHLSLLTNFKLKSFFLRLHALSYKAKGKAKRNVEFCWSCAYQHDTWKLTEKWYIDWQSLKCQKFELQMITNRKEQATLVCLRKSLMWNPGREMRLQPLLRTIK